MFNTTAECIIDSLMKKDNVICNEKDLQLGTEYIFPKIGVRLWRERAFHPKLLKDPLYMEEMQAVAIPDVTNAESDYLSMASLQ